MAQVVFENITKAFGPVRAVDNLDLIVEDGEFLVLVGPSGCGKTTALRMVAGLEEPTSGRILIGEDDVTYAEPKHRDIGMVFQNYALYPQMTVYDNIAFGLRQRKTPKSEVDERVRDVSSILGLGELLDRRPKQMSGGQRQRVALGRAIARRPRVFLMDEPLSNLDAQLRGRTRAELSRLHRTLQTTTIYVTHDQVEAMTMGSRIAVMNQGVLQQVDTPTRVYEEPANTFVASFIGSPPMNLVTGELTDGGTWFTGTGVRAHLGVAPSEAPQQVVLGLRPEHLVVASDDDVPVFSGTIELVEPLGSDQIVTMTTESGPVLARLHTRHILTAGETLSLAIGEARPLLFSAATGERIALPALSPQPASTNASAAPTGAIHAVEGLPVDASN